MLSTGARRLFFLAALTIGFGSGALSAAPCVPSPTRLCLSGGRFAVEATWKDGEGATRKAQALALPGTDAGSFWFFAPENPELAVKVLDGRPVNGFFWVFYAGLTSLPTKIAVTDTATGRVKMYDLGAFASQGDTGAFRSAAAASDALDRLAFPGDVSSEAAPKADLVADFTFSPNEPRTGESISFTDQSSGSPDRWCWVFGDETGSGCTSEQPSAVHSYAQAGTYDVHLSVGRTDGPSVLISEIVKTVTVGALPPPPPLCSFSITPTTAMFEPEGGTGSVRLTASASDCPWTVESIPASVNSVTPRGGAESATITFQVERNDTGDVRTGSLVIAGQTFRILQNGQPCTFDIDPGELFLTPSGQTGTVAVDAPAGCGWKASIESGSDFISHLDPVSGSGPGLVRFQVAPNPGDSSRTGTLSVAAKSVGVTQLAADVDFYFSPSSPRAGQVVTFFGKAKEPPTSWCWTFGDGSELPGNCAATTPEPTHAYFSVGTRTVKLKVIRNDDTVAEVTKPITVGASPPPPPCTFELDPRELFLTPSGQTGTVSVYARVGCGWKASIESGSDFISHLDPVSGSGPGVVRFQVDTNPGDASRLATLRIADKPVRVTQLAADIDFYFSPSSPRVGAIVTFFGKAKEPPASWCWTFGDGSEPPGGCAAMTPEATHSYSSAGNFTIKLKVIRNDDTVAEVTKPIASGGPPGDCVFELSPRLQSFDFGGGDGEVTVAAAANCTWTAQSKASFVTITTGSSGSGNGTLTYRVAENGSPDARTGVLRVAGRLFLVQQKGKPCISLDPVSAIADPAGGVGTVTVTAPEGCSWAAASNDSFLLVTSVTDHSVSYRVDPNRAGASRTGRLTIGGVDFPVSQEPCVYTLTSSISGSLDTAGGTETVQIATQNGCPWQAVASDAFIKFSAAASGKGSGAFEYCVAANRGAERQGKIEIAAGVMIDVPQAGFDPAPVGCHQNDTTLCLLNGRFEVRAAFRGFSLEHGVGRLRSLSGGSGYVTFFNPANLEVLLKMIDGRTLNDHFWLFYGSLSNVGYVITASDTETGEVNFYCNPTGTFRSVGDTLAFPPPEP